MIETEETTKNLYPFTYYNNTLSLMESVQILTLIMIDRLKDMNMRNPKDDDELELDKLRVEKIAELTKRLAGDNPEFDIFKDSDIL